MAEEEFRLPTVFGDGMVLQRDFANPVWGWAAPGQKVHLSFNGKVHESETGSDGRWMLRLPAAPAGGPYEMKVSCGGKEFLVKDIMIGEVWLCAGQSNMGWWVSQSENADEEIRNAKYPEIRVFTEGWRASFSPQKDARGGCWLQCSPENAGIFSAVGYFFARELHKKLGVPVGIICAAWGGTPIEAWMSSGALASCPSLKAQLEEMNGKLPSLQTKESELLKKETGQRKYFSEILASEKIVLPEGIQALKGAQVEMPSIFNKSAPGTDGLLWLRRFVNISSDIAGKEASLSLGVPEEMLSVYLNGTYVGSLRNASQGALKISPGCLKAGKNEIIVGILNTGGLSGLSGKEEDMKLSVENEKHIGLSGAWELLISERTSYTFSPVSAYPSFPSVLFNGMLNPIIPLSIRGIVWYQGEANTARAGQYSELLNSFIKDLRLKWERENLCFITVQLPNHRGTGDWAMLRDAQMKTLELNDTCIAVTIDLGDEKEIHSKKKVEIGRRAALAALSKTYRQESLCYGPLYKEMKKEDGKIRIFFEPTRSPLVSSDGSKLRNFKIAGADKTFFSANAEIEGDCVLVWNDEVKSPEAVRYAWENWPEPINLYNKQGLPAAPFKTDSWERQ